MIEIKDLPRMETIEKTAKLFGLAKYYVRQLAIQNKIKYVKSGKKYLINVEKFAEFLNGYPSETDTNVSNEKERKVI